MHINSERSNFIALHDIIMEECEKHDATSRACRINRANTSMFITSALNYLLGMNVWSFDFGRPVSRKDFDYIDQEILGVVITITQQLMPDDDIQQDRLRVLTDILAELKQRGEEFEALMTAQTVTH